MHINDFLNENFVKITSNFILQNTFIRGSTIDISKVVNILHVNNNLTNLPLKLKGGHMNMSIQYLKNLTTMPNHF